MTSEIVKILCALQWRVFSSEVGKLNKKLAKNELALKKGGGQAIPQRSMSTHEPRNSVAASFGVTKAKIESIFNYKLGFFLDESRGGAKLQT